jgi:hypothetical protein
MAGIYDKRLEDKFKDIKVNRYPDIDSALSDRSKYGIVSSQMHRFSRRCSLNRDFVYNTSLVVHRLIEKGYSTLSVWKLVRKFIKGHAQIYDKAMPDVWMHRFQCKLSDLQSGFITPGPNGLVVATQHSGE